LFEVSGISVRFFSAIKRLDFQNINLFSELFIGLPLLFAIVKSVPYRARGFISLRLSSTMLRWG
jgi:hypothetical protein